MFQEIKSVIAVMYEEMRRTYRKASQSAVLLRKWFLEFPMLLFTQGHLRKDCYLEIWNANGCLAFLKDLVSIFGLHCNFGSPEITFFSKHFSGTLNTFLKSILCTAAATQKLFSSSKSISTVLWRTSSHSDCWPDRSMHYQFQPLTFISLPSCV